MLTSATHLIRAAVARRHPILHISQQHELKEKLEAFISALPVHEIAAEVSESTGVEQEKIVAMITTFANESRVTLDLIIEQIEREIKILEVGAGLCILSLFLRQQQFHITALEPALGGFGLFEQIKQSLRHHLGHIDLTVLEVPAGALQTAEHGSFDLIFSNNVIEHIPEWQEAIDAMASLLNSDGMMVHASPNYSIPYEPHYGVPVFRAFPDLSRRLFLASDADTEIWDSLNFITANQLMSHCNRTGLNICFRKELLYKAIKRIDDDPVFKARHQGMVATLASLIMRSGLGELIRRISPRLSTPMIAEFRHGRSIS